MTTKTDVEKLRETVRAVGYPCLMVIGLNDHAAALLNIPITEETLDDDADDIGMAMVVADVHKTAFPDERHVAAHRVLLVLYDAAFVLREKADGYEAIFAKRLAQAKALLDRTLPEAGAFRQPS